MSDLVITLNVAFISAAAVAIVWLRQRAAALIRAEQRDERDNGIVARLRGQFEQLDADVRNMRSEQKQFLANARAR
jgi:hypothetical protein